MTTVAFDGRVMAADTGVGYPYIDEVRIAKVRWVDEALLGFAGDMMLIERFIEWYVGDRKDLAELGPSNDGLSVLAAEEGRILYWDEHGRCVQQEAPCAIGSGAMLAMGAMLTGATAAEAVEIALRLDPHTNGEVRSISLRDFSVVTSVGAG